MPTYLYRCPRCGREFQKFHKMTARVRPKCPECGATAERKITGGAGLHFKGSGFYVTDYKKGADKADRADKTDQADRADKGNGADKTDKGDKTGKVDGGGGSASTAAKRRKPDSGAQGSDS
jgi:putative FmdB family regulatory protein